MIESGGGKKNAQKVMINISIVEFAQITDFGTYTDIFAYHFLTQYIDFSLLNRDIGRKSHPDLNQPENSGLDVPINNMGVLNEAQR